MVNFACDRLAGRTEAGVYRGGWVPVDKSDEELSYTARANVGTQDYVELPMSTLYLFGRHRIFRIRVQRRGGCSGAAPLQCGIPDRRSTAHAWGLAATTATTDSTLAMVRTVNSSGLHGEYEILWPANK